MKSIIYIKLTHLLSINTKYIYYYNISNKKVIVHSLLLYCLLDKQPIKLIYFTIIILLFLV
jgi:hypothetical protein